MLAKSLDPSPLASAEAAPRRRFHVDFHILLTLLQRGWGILAGGIMVIFIPTWFTQVEQGYYYTFLSLLALQVFFELGFNVVIVQLVSHEMAHLRIDEAGQLTGDPARICRLNSLLSMLRKWYLTAAVLFFCVVSVAGYFFFRTKGTLPVSSWIGVWISLVFFTSVNLYLSPQLAVLEGVGHVGQVARMRLFQSMCGFGLMWTALSLHAGLYAIPLLTATAASAGLWWLRSHRRLLHPKVEVDMPSASRMRWRTEIFPLQWRIAVSWISGYFIFQAFTPLIFAHQGAVEAGRIGIALTIFSAISALGMSWMNASAPKLAQYIARNERADLNQLFTRVLKSSVAFTALASLFLLLIVATLQWLDSPMTLRIASLPILACLAAVAVTNSFIFGAATYMRAHKAEPLLCASVVGGLLTLAAVYFGSHVSSLLTMILYMAATMLVGLPWTIHLFLPYFNART